jgi:hypothetical protein
MIDPLDDDGIAAFGARPEVARIVVRGGRDHHVDVALAHAAVLLSGCEGRDARAVLHGTLGTCLPGLRCSLYVVTADGLDVVGGAGEAMTTILPCESCWALRLRRVHLSPTAGLLRCDHVGDPVDTACLPLVCAGRVWGLVVVQATSTTPLPPAATLTDLALRVGFALGQRWRRADAARGGRHGHGQGHPPDDERGHHRAGREEGDRHERPAHGRSGVVDDRPTTPARTPTTRRSG